VGKMGRCLALTFAAPLLLGGCGTMMGNIGYYGIFWGHHMEPYGGVKICLASGATNFKEVFDPSEQRRDWGAFLAGTYMLVVDLPLSTVADTVTLPWTIKATLKGEAITGPVIQPVEDPPIPNAN
jgi:uncharacterized protein YceK